MTCTINPYSQEINSDEFILILNANNLYKEYRGLIDNDQNLAPFFKTYQNLLESSINSIKQLRSLLKGETSNLSDINNDKIINYFLNNSVNQNILNEIDQNFTNALYRRLEQGKPLMDLLDVNELFTASIIDNDTKGSNTLIGLLANLLKNKSKILEKINNTESEFEKEYLNRKLEYINSLGLSENINKPITTKANFQNNTRLRQLINFLGREGLFTLNSKLVDDVNNEIDDLEEDIQIYDKDPLTENPSDKISTRLKLLLRSIPQYDSESKNIVKINGVIPKFWKPSDLILKLLKRISKNKIHNLTASQILNELNTISKTKGDPLSSAVTLFLERFNIIKKNQENNKVTSYDILTDLFMYFQQMPVGIKITEETIDKRDPNSSAITKIIDATDFEGYQLKLVRENVVKDLLMNPLIKANLTKTVTPVSVITINDLLTNLFKNFVNDNENVIKNSIASVLKINTVFDENMLISIAKIVIKENNVLNTSEVNKVYNINNDTLYPVIKPSELTEKISLINKSILQVKNNIPFEETDFYKTFKDDIIIKSIWSDYIKNKGNELKVSIFTGFKTFDKATEWSDFNDGEFLANMFNLLNNDLYHTPVLSDKSNIYIIENFNKGFSEQSIQEELSGQTDNSVKIPYFDDIISFLDIDTTLATDGSEGSIGKNMDKALSIQKLFLFNPEYYNLTYKEKPLTNDYVIELYNKYKNSKNKAEKLETERELSGIINVYFNNLAKQYLNGLMLNGYITQDKGIYSVNWRQSLIKNPAIYYNSDNLLNYIKQAAIKSYIYSNHISLITNGHPAFFKQNDEQKRTKAVVADTIKPNIEASYKGERLFDTTNPTSRRIVLKDVEKAVVNEIAEKFMLQGLENRGLSKDLILTRMAKIYSNYTLLDGTPIYTLEKDNFLKLKEEYDTKVNEVNDNTELSQEEKDNKLEDLKNSYLNKEKEIKHKITTLSNTTDASSVASLDHTRKYNISLNMYSDDQEEFYAAETNGKPLKKFTKNNNKIIKNAVYTKVKSKNTGVLVPHMEKTSTDNFTAQRVFLGETPNLYQAMIGKMFGYTFNETNKSWSYNPENAITDKVVYESAVKAEMLTDEEGNPIIFDLQKEIEDSNITTLNDVNNWKPKQDFIDKHVIEIPFVEDRLQVETPEHLEAEGDLGSQIEALIHNSINIDEEYSIGNKFFNGQELTQVLNNLKITMTENGANLVRQRFSDFELLHELILELYNEREHLNPETLTVEKLEELLKNPQFGLALVSKIQSTIRKNIVKTKMNTVQFFNGVVGEDDSLKMITEVSKDAEGKEITKLIFEVAVPAFSKDIFNGALNENDELDVNLLPEEIKDLIVYRIPTEAVYSMFVVRIKKILHPAAGPIIYMPIGTTTMAGFDMDIDKLFGILKNYKVNKEGKIKVIPYSLDKDSNINFKEWYKENISEKDKEIQVELFEQKNKLIEDNPELLNTNKELKELLNQKNKIIKDISNNLLDIVNDSERKNKFFKLLNNNEEYLSLKEEIEKIHKSQNIKKFKEINDKLFNIEKLYEDNWKKLSLTQQMSSKQLQNLNFDIFKGVIGSQINVDTYLQGNNADRLEEINNELPVNTTTKALNTKFPYKDKNIMNALTTFKAIMSGAKNIGPTAINNQLIAYLKFLYNFNPTNNNLGLTIGGKLTFLTNNKDNQEIFNLFRGINNFKSISGSTANISNAVLLAQAVDNIKKDLSVPLNLHKNLMGVRAVMYILGIDENIVDRMFTEVSAVDNIIKESIKDGSINKFRGNIFKGLSEPSKLVKEIVDSNNNTTYEINLDLLNKKFKKGEYILDTLNLKENDILAFLNIVQDLANELDDLVKTMNYFYKGFGKNFNELTYAYIKTNDLLNNLDNKDLNLNIEGTFIKHKLQTLQNLSSEIYKNFSIYLDNNFFTEVITNKRFKDTFFKPKYLGYLFNSLSSANLYINLISQFGSAENLQNAYFKEIQDLMYIFGQNTVVEIQGNSYVKADNQNNMLGVLQNIVKFNRGRNNIFFAKSIEELNSLNEQYNNNISFLGQSESIDTLQTPKSIVDLMSVDNQTLFVGSNTDINELTPQEVFSAQDIAKKLFFVNMVQSALFSGKSNKGRSNVFDLLFLDNLLLQNDLITPVQGSLYELLKNNNKLISNLKNNEILDNLYLFSFINNSELFEKNTYNVGLKVKKDFIKNQIINLFKGYVNSDSLIINFNDINSTVDSEKETISLSKTKALFFNKDFIIVPITQNNVQNNYLYTKTNLGFEKYLYTKVGIVNNFNSKFNPIYFNILDKINNQLGLNTSTYVPVEISKDNFIRKNSNYRSYGLKRDIIVSNITEVEQELINNATGVISVVNPRVELDFSSRSLSLKPYNTEFVRVTPLTQPSTSVIPTDNNLRFKFNTNPNETILLTKSFANTESLSDETKKMIDGHIKLGNKFIFSSNLSNKLYLEYLVDKKYDNFEIFGQNSKYDMTESEINLLINNLQDKNITIKPITQPNKLVEKKVEELFDSNPELANQVYKALGFTVSDSSIALDKINNTKIGENVTLFINNMPVKYKKVSKNYFEGKQITEKQETDFINSAESATTSIEEFIEKEGSIIRYSLDDLINFYLEKLPKFTPTLQQKQQALQLYSQYLDTGKQDVEGFKEFVNQNQFTQSTKEDNFNSVPDCI
jgi:hypothetical protein